MSRDIWSPRQYREYGAERARPFYELLARVGAENPSFVVDLGCGPGERTADLAARWPGAVIEGIDRSEQMIAEAHRMIEGTPPEAGGAVRSGVRDRLRFRGGDLAEWKPDRPVDVIFSNAALQWVPEHRRLMPAWIEALVPGGWLAFSMPGNFGAPSHVLLRELCGSPRWRDRLERTVRHHDIVSDPMDYFEQLSGLGCDVDAWETTYLQVLPGRDPVLEWMKGTALRPVIDVLPDEAEREEFLAELADRLRAAYPPGSQGTVFPFRRIFVAAQKRSDTR